jgi:hypothetical protein
MWSIVLDSLGPLGSARRDRENGGRGGCLIEVEHVEPEKMMTGQLSAA